jgi:hypothetical protein
MTVTMKCSFALGGVVLSVFRGVGMMSDRTEVTAVPLEGSWLTLALAFGLAHLAQLGLGRLGLLINRCLETPGDYITLTRRHTNFVPISIILEASLKKSFYF